jgi:hypothetical protein
MVVLGSVMVARLAFASRPNVKVLEFQSSMDADVPSSFQVWVTVPTEFGQAIVAT